MIEIMDPTFPCADSYALGSALGQVYWLPEGTPMQEGKLGYSNNRIDPETLRSLLGRIDEAIAARCSPR